MEYNCLFAVCRMEKVHYFSMESILKQHDFIAKIFQTAFAARKRLF